MKRVGLWLLTILFNVCRKLFEVPPPEPFVDEHGNLCVWDNIAKTSDELRLDACYSGISTPIGMEMNLMIHPFKPVKRILVAAADRANTTA